MTLPPLLGRRVLVTRAAHQAGKLSQGLRALGAEPVEVPVLEIHPPTSFTPLDTALRQFASYDWLILTSANAVHALIERAAAVGISLAQPAWLKVAAVGESTSAEARKAGFKIAFVPQTYVAESLVEGLLKTLQNKPSGQRILLARAAVARDVIPDALRSAGAAVDVVDSTQSPSPAPPAQSIWPKLPAPRTLRGRLPAFPLSRLDRLPARRCANSDGSPPLKPSLPTFQG